MKLVHDGLFQVDPPALLGQRCRACGAPAFPRADACPLCGASAPDPVVLSDTGTLWAWTEVTAPPPGYLGEVPFGFGIVELPEEIRVITRLGGSVDDLEHGCVMTLRLVTLGHGDDAVMSWEFTR
ncbi:MAG TPA: OB-fold domain-containing protein [Acidimicrobiia bacterium]|nr:OB-fold domain-containing protein [Acidimicrobiia bacterium]